MHKGGARLSWNEKCIDIIIAQPNRMSVFWHLKNANECSVRDFYDCPAINWRGSAQSVNNGMWHLMAPVSGRSALRKENTLKRIRR